ncbi:DEAD/DEAH box helicase [Burkholderia ubonensis]|uniref:DEAD/DEAH box helicase n=1 Tax=Burkholderia ubonensis TaxID=101571 RepID=UPI001E636C02|nr:DEAD/DEAH box helicase [Burkholderia ubonensis]
MLDEAMLLVECGLIERADDPNSAWRASLQRAAQIVEWLSQDGIRPAGSPLHLIAAAIYQVADLPAMALGHLRRMPANEPSSEILRRFLAGDFPAALAGVGAYWRDEHMIDLPRFDEAVTNADIELSRLTEQHVVKCVGTVCAYLRTGNGVPIERALKKLENLAGIFLHSRDPYSYLLARLVAACARRFTETCLWPHVKQLSANASSRAGEALVQFARAAFLNRRALVWPAQVEGIKRLSEAGSFVLCTPTGSGKTTIATLGVVQGLFDAHADDPSLADIGPGNLILYLVPSRALAAEVEHRLSEDLRGIDARPVVVTGLYGGVDWGPTDAWIQSSDPTIVICTFEKADALLRYLGVLFLDRLRLVIIDEAHMVELDAKRQGELAGGGSRALRLEQLGMRLRRAQDAHGFRLIALSAVAAHAAPAMASWLSGAPHARPVISTHRSTRQMIGRLEISQKGTFTIHYDLMDGHSLRFHDQGGEASPYVREPFGPIPSNSMTGGPDQRMRGPTLWAALNLAGERSDGRRPAVLISITQHIGGFAKTCADLMDQWEGEALPAYSAIDEDDAAWQRCLASAADYFTERSVEYRLLKRGIAVHHGQLPPLLARRLKVVIDRGLVRVVIATSTLSEGVNIPVNVVLIPNVHRATEPMEVQEFMNLIGRAGRPGVATEGAAFVVMPEVARGTWDRQRTGYQSIIEKMQQASDPAGHVDAALHRSGATSPLQLLLEALHEEWARLDGIGTFEAWLSSTAVIGEAAQRTDERLLGLLDSLDGVLIAALQEVVQLKAAELAGAELELELARIWRCTYAAAAAQSEGALQRRWLTRGLAIHRLYPDATQRRKIYKTSLPPRSATLLLNIAESLRTVLQAGGDYAQRSPQAQLAFVTEVLESLAQVPAFEIASGVNAKSDWQRVLQWWLARGTLTPKQRPRPEDGPKWFKFASTNFIYRGNWGLGGLISVLMDRGDGDGPLRALEIGDWPKSGLPWIAFWLKELISWGTLDPVAAFLLARGNALDRDAAEAEARQYYDAMSHLNDANDLLDPREIRRWVQHRRASSATPRVPPDLQFTARLVRPADAFLTDTVSVSPTYTLHGLAWLDPAGHVVAYSDMPENGIDDATLYDFDLQVHAATIVASAYLTHRSAAL